MSMTVLPLIPVPADLSCTLADHAFGTLRLEYLHNPACPDEGIWNFLGTNGFVWGPDRPDTCFNLAAMAVSLAAYGIKNSELPALEQSRTKYTKALSKTRSALCSHPVDPTDELLLTCLLLSAYEVSQALQSIHKSTTDADRSDRTVSAAPILQICSRRAFDIKMGPWLCLECAAWNHQADASLGLTNISEDSL